MAVIVVGTEKNFAALRPRIFSGRVSNVALKETTEALVAANPGVDLEKLQPGTILTVPDSPHVSVKGDVSLDDTTKQLLEGLANTGASTLKELVATAQKTERDAAAERKQLAAALSSKDVDAAVRKDQALGAGRQGCAGRRGRGGEAGKAARRRARRGARRLGQGAEGAQGASSRRRCANEASVVSSEEPSEMPELRLTKPPTKGPAVRNLQKRLTALGFDTGGIDGEFGKQTDTAVRAFQKAKGLDVDGVAGAGTIAALKGGRSPGKKVRPAPERRPGTLDHARIAAVIGCPVKTIRANWPPLLEALSDYGIDTLPCQIATLATVGTEVGSFAPINEYGGPAYFKKMYEGRKDLGNVRAGDGVRYHGRGYIQLTGRANYRTYGEKLGVPLEKKPDLALRPDIAAKVLAAYVNDHGIAKLAAGGDWQGVRRAVNGGLNGWDRFSTLVQGLQQAVQATTDEPVGRGVSSAGFASPLRLASPTERSDRVKEAQLVLAGANVFKQDFHVGTVDGEWGPLSRPRPSRRSTTSATCRRPSTAHSASRSTTTSPGPRSCRQPSRRGAAKRLKELASGGDAKSKAVDAALADAKKGVAETPVNLTPFGQWYGMNGVAWCCIYVTYQLVQGRLPGVRARQVRVVLRQRRRRRAQAGAGPRADEGARARRSRHLQQGRAHRVLRRVGGEERVVQGGRRQHVRARRLEEQRRAGRAEHTPRARELPRDVLRPRRRVAKPSRACSSSS